MKEGCQKLRKTQGPKSIREIQKVDTTEYIQNKKLKEKMYETTKLWFQSGYIIYIYYTATPFPTVNQSHVKKNPYFIHFFLADSSAANSQNGGPGVCHFLVLVWASGVAGFSKMVSTPIVLQIPWCVGGPPNRRPEKA